MPARSTASGCSARCSACPLCGYGFCPRRSIMSSMLLNLSLAVVLAPAPADEKINLPSGPPPKIVLAVIKDGKCEVQYTVTVASERVQTVTRVENLDGKQVQVPQKVVVTIY